MTSEKNQLLKVILNECGQENIPNEKIQALSKLLNLDDIPWLMQALKSLDLAQLEHDAGDIGDEYWRITVAISALVISLGEEALPRLSPFECENHTYVQMALKFIKEEQYLREYKSDFFGSYA